MSQLPDKVPAANLEDSDSDSDSDSGSDSDSDLSLHIPCHNSLDMTYGLEIKTNSISHFGRNLRVAITNCEIMILDYNRRLQELGPVAGPSNAVVQIDENAPSCSGTSANSRAKVGPHAGTTTGATAGATAGSSIGVSGDANTDASGDANADASGNANADASVDANADASVDANADARGDANAGASGDANANAIKDTDAAASSDANAAAGAVANGNASVNAGVNAGANAGANDGANAGANAGDDNEIDLFSEHRQELANYVRLLNYRRTRNSEIQTLGSWLFISYVNGGWDYDTVRNYLLEQFGVTCMRCSANDVLVTNKKFKAIVKFESSEQLNLVVMSLRKNHIHDNFLFLSFDKLAIDFASDSDSDSDESRSGFLIPLTHDFDFQ